MLLALISLIIVVAGKSSSLFEQEIRDRIEAIKLCKLFPTSSKMCRHVHNVHHETDQETELSRTRRFLPAQLAIPKTRESPICDLQPCQKSRNLFRVAVR